MDFLNKVVIITGASSGIGAAAAVLYAKQSAKLVLVARNQHLLNEVAKQCEAAKGITPLVVKADITVDDEVENVITQTIDTFGRIDVLVNNAGIAVLATLSDGVEPFDRIMSINMRSAYLLSSLAKPHLIATKGNIVNVSSITSFRPYPGVDCMPYCISKAAMDQFTKCIAVELGPHGVRVNSVNPGHTRTNFAELAGLSNVQVAEFRKKLQNSSPLRKFTECEEVADLILYLSNARARSITGALCVIDNGEILM